MFSKERGSSIPQRAPTPRLSFHNLRASVYFE